MCYSLYNIHKNTDIKINRWKIKTIKFSSATNISRSFFFFCCFLLHNTQFFYPLFYDVNTEYDKNLWKFSYIQFFFKTNFPCCKIFCNKQFKFFVCIYSYKLGFYRLNFHYSFILKKEKNIFYKKNIQFSMKNYFTYTMECLTITFSYWKQKAEQTNKKL